LRHTWHTFSGTSARAWALWSPCTRRAHPSKSGVGERPESEYGRGPGRITRRDKAPDGRRREGRAAIAGRRAVEKLAAPALQRAVLQVERVSSKQRISRPPVRVIELPATINDRAVSGSHEGPGPGAGSRPLRTPSPGRAVIELRGNDESGTIPGQPGAHP